MWPPFSSPVSEHKVKSQTLDYSSSESLSHPEILARAVRARKEQARTIEAKKERTVASSTLGMNSELLGPVCGSTLPMRVKTSFREQAKPLFIMLAIIILGLAIFGAYYHWRPPPPPRSFFSFRK